MTTADRRASKDPKAGAALWSSRSIWEGMRLRPGVSQITERQKVRVKRWDHGAGEIPQSLVFIVKT